MSFLSSLWIFLEHRAETEAEGAAKNDDIPQSCHKITLSLCLANARGKYAPKGNFTL